MTSENGKQKMKNMSKHSHLNEKYYNALTKRWVWVCKCGKTTDVK